MRAATINRQAMDMGRIDAVVEAGTVEIWEVTGISVPHNFHVHGVQFQVPDASENTNTMF